MRVFLRTFGCRANQYDTELVQHAVEQGGGTVVRSPEEADIAVFNSCAVTAEAEADLRQGVRRAARSQPVLRSVVMGCAAARDPDALRTLPTVDAVVAGGDVAAVAAALGVAMPTFPPGVQTGARALLRIQDGCDQHCTFCATTLARGAGRSRAPDALVHEASALGERHPEIVLTGVHIGRYGDDIGSSLGTLLERLVREVPGVRFRLSSVEATEVDDRLGELLAWDPLRVAPYLHAPLQSGSDAVLRRMGRTWYTAAAYASALERIVGGRPVFGVGADVIAGFPGETAADHRATLALVRSLPFTALHVFPYSARPGTAATRLPAPVPAPEVSRRAAELRALGEDKARAYRARRLGGTADVVVVSAGGRREALTGDYLTALPAAGAGANTPARGARYAARLTGTAEQLVAVPLERDR